MIGFRDEPRVHESDDGNRGFCQTYLLVNAPVLFAQIWGLLTLSFSGAEVLRGRAMCLTLFRTSLSGEPPSCFTGSSNKLVILADPFGPVNVCGLGTSLKCHFRIVTLSVTFSFALFLVLCGGHSNMCPYRDPYLP
jgi:hypothetical protein